MHAAKVSEQVNTNCIPGTRFYNFQPHTPTLFPQTSHPENFGILVIYYIVHCWSREHFNLFTVLRIAKIARWHRSDSNTVIAGTRGLQSAISLRFLLL